MTGPEHYKAAEKDASLGDECFEGDPGGASLYYQSAQIHATLALAAATALQPSGYSVVHAEWRAWRDVCKTPADAQERNR